MTRLISSPSPKWCGVLAAASILAISAAAAAADRARTAPAPQDEPQATAPVPPPPISTTKADDDALPIDAIDTPPWGDESGVPLLEDACTTCDEAVIDEGLGERFWFQADYLLWWTKGSRLPALLTTGPTGASGVLGDPQTRTLYGDQYVNDSVRSGYRLSAGVWLDACQTVAVVADYFDLQAGTAPYFAASNASSVLARPFYDVQAAQDAAQLVDNGTVAILNRDFFQSTGAQLLFNLLSADCCEPVCSDCCTEGTCGLGDDCGNLRRWGYQIGLLAGYRYYRLDDALSIRENFTSTTPPFTGTTFDISDQFRTENRFHGADIGFQTRVYRGRWSVGLLTKMAIGNNRQVVTIDGRTITTLPNLPPVTSQGGFLTTVTNIGRYTDDQFTVIPQLGLDIGYDLTDWLRLVAGYNLIYWPHVQRAAGQIDAAIDPRNLPPVQPGGTVFPRPQLVTQDFWAQGVNFGVQLRY